MGCKMRKYLGLLSFLVLVIVGLIWGTMFNSGSFLNSITPKVIRESDIVGFGLPIAGLLLSAGLCWFSPKGVWKYVSATLIIGIPVGFITIVVLFAVSHM